MHFTYVLFTACIISIVTWIKVSIYLARRTGDWLHIGVAFSLLFAFSYPLKTIASMFGLYVLNPFDVHSAYIWQALILSNLSALLFILPFFSPYRVQSYSSPQNHRSQSIKKTFLLFFVALLIISFSHGLQSVVASLSFSGDALTARISERALERSNTSFSAILRSVGQVFLIISCINISNQWDSLGRATRSVFIALLSLSSTFLLLVSGSKFEALAPFAFTLLNYHIHNIQLGQKLTNPKTLLILAVSTIFLIMLAGYFRGFVVFRTLSDQNQFYLALVQLTNAFDAPDNLTLILSRVNDPLTGDLNLKPLTDNVLGLIPRYAWPDKPSVFGNLHIQSIYLYERFMGHDGEVISPSMAGEMIVSGGLFYLIPISYALGYFYKIHYIKAMSSNSWVWRSLYLFCFISLINIMRSGTSFISAYLLFFCSVSLVVFLSSLFRPFKISS